MPCPVPSAPGWSLAIEAWHRSDSRTYGELTYGEELYGDLPGQGLLSWNDITAAAVEAVVQRGSETGELHPPIDRLSVTLYDPTATLLDFQAPATLYRPIPGTPLRLRLIDPQGTATTIVTTLIETVQAEHRAGQRVVMIDAYGIASQFSTDVVSFTAPEQTVYERVSELSVLVPLTYDPTDQPDYQGSAPLSPDRNVMLQAIEQPGTVNALDEIRATLTSVGNQLHERRDGSTRILRWPIEYEGTPLVVADCLGAGDAAATAIGYTMDLAECLNHVTVRSSQASTAPATSEPTVQPPDTSPPMLPNVSGTVTLPDYAVRPYHALARTNYTIVPSQTTTRLNLSTTTGVDTDGMVSTSNDVITVPVSGAYLLVGQVQETTIGHNRVVVNLRVNGSTVAKDDYQTATATTVWRGATVATFRYLYAGDQVSMEVWQSTTGNVTFGSGAGYLGVAQVQSVRNTPGQRTVPLNLTVTDPSAADAAGKLDGKAAGDSSQPAPRTDYVTTTISDQQSIELFGVQASTMGAPYRSTVTNTLSNGQLIAAFAQRVLDRFAGNVNRPSYVTFDARTDPAWLQVTADQLDHGQAIDVLRVGLAGRPMRHRCIWAGHELRFSSRTGLQGRVTLQTIEQTI